MKRMYVVNFSISLIVAFIVFLGIKYIFGDSDISSSHFIVMVLTVFVFTLKYPYSKAVHGKK